MNRIVVCHNCDLAVDVPPTLSGQKYVCPRCGTVLHAKREINVSTVAAIALSCLSLLSCCLWLPFMSLSSMGLSVSMTLLTIYEVMRLDWLLLLQFFFFVTFAFPVLLLLILIWVGLFKGRLCRFIVKIYSLSHRMCMVDVFVLSVAVSLVKLTAMAHVSFHSGFFIAFIFSILLIWCCLVCPPKRMWRIYRADNVLEGVTPGLTGMKQGILVCRHCGMPFKSAGHGDEEECPRCGAKVGYRNIRWVQKCTAYLLAACFMYLPANIFPIMYTRYLGVTYGNNIIDGVITLWKMGSWFVGSVILLASVCIPVFKISALFYLLYEVKLSRRTRSKFLSRLYRFVAYIGKWSMVDVFVVIIMSSIVRMSIVLTISPGFAIVCFCIVVLITLIAAEEFDERLIWDREQSVNA